MFKDGDTQIGTLHVRKGKEDSNHPALFRRLSFLFNTVDFSAPGMPPSGILLVRHMEDPLPGKLTAHENAHRANPGWEQAVKDVLIKKYRGAARPVRGFIPADAEAVFFEDEGRMLAALALDIGRGRAGNRWWWKVILRRLHLLPSPDLKTLFCSRIIYLPAIMHHLSEWGTVAAVMDTLSTAQTRAVLAELGRQYGLDEIITPVLQKKEMHRHDGFPRHPGSLKEKQEEKPVSHRFIKNRQPFDPAEALETGGSFNISVKAPWEQWFPSHAIPARMAGEREVLPGIALSLYHAPAKVRTPGFARLFQEWWTYRRQQEEKIPVPAREREDVSLSTSPPPPYPAAAKQEKTKTAKPFLPASGRDTGTLSQSPPGPGHVSPTHDNQGKEVNQPEAIPHKEKEIRKPKTGFSFKTKAQKPRFSGKIRFEEEDHDTEPAQTGPVDTALPTMPIEKEAEKIETKQPITVEASTPPDLGEGVDTGLGGAFYLINVIERLDLLNSLKESVQPDEQIGPWGVLALLTHGLLEEKFQSLESDPLWRVPAELEGSGETDELLKNASSCISQWLDSVLPDTRAFLRRVLGPPTREDPEPEKTMLVCPARLYVTSTHVDIVMSLEDISLPVRLAGLDRDPGWIPEFARVILFHFQ